MLKLTKRGKNGIYHITGTVGGQRVRESTGTASEHHAQAMLTQRQSEILDRLTFGQKRTATFAEAVELHLNKKGDTLGASDALFISRLNAHFGSWRLADIKEADIAAFAAATYPRCGPHGIDRQVYTPLIAIYRRAAAAELCDLRLFQRPEKPDRKPIEPATDEEIMRLLPHGTDRLVAAALFMSFSGARVAEACRLQSTDVDWLRQEALLRTTKTGKPRVVPLAGIVFEAMTKLRGRQGLLFGFKGRHSFNQALARACKRAGIRKLTSHKIGRHAFAARLLQQGYTLKEVQEGGGWGSYRMVANVFGHLERSSVHNAMRAADTNLARLIDGSSNVVRIQSGRK